MKNKIPTIKEIMKKEKLIEKSKSSKVSKVKRNYLPQLIKEKKDENGNVIFKLWSNGYWTKRKFDKNNNEIYNEDSTGYWCKNIYDENNNVIYCEDSVGYFLIKEGNDELIRINGVYYLNGKELVKEEVEK